MHSAYSRNRAQAHLVAKRLAEMMVERHVTRKDLAASVRIQQVTLENYCAGRIIPPDMLSSIAYRLETTVAYLTGASDDPQRPPALGVS